MGEPIALRAWSVAERIVAGVALVGAVPLISICAAAVAAASRNSPFVAHERVRRHGDTFWMWKLRTMWERDRPQGRVCLVEYLQDPFVPEDKCADDPRVTHPLGRWLRRFSIDELPQLVHAVRGEMALIGPRPITRREFAEHYGDDAQEVLTVRPGISGLWQVSGRNRLTYAERKAFDLQYVRGRDALWNLRILLRTIPAILRKAEVR